MDIPCVLPADIYVFREETAEEVEEMAVEEPILRGAC